MINRSSVGDFPVGTVSSYPGTVLSLPAFYSQLFVIAVTVANMVGKKLALENLLYFVSQQQGPGPTKLNRIKQIYVFSFLTRATGFDK